MTGPQDDDPSPDVVGQGLGPFGEVPAGQPSAGYPYGSSGSVPPGYAPPGYGPPGYGPPAYVPPGYAPPGYGPPAYVPPAYGPPPGYRPPYLIAPSPPMNALAVTSLVLGVTWLYWIGSLLAVIFGHIALHQLKTRAEGGRGLAIAGVVLGYIGLFIALVVVIVVVVAVRHGCLETGDTC